MPTRLKPQPSTKPLSVKPAPPSAPATPGWKWKVLAGLFLVLILFALWGSGAFKELFAGPKIPLPREVGNLSLGMTLDEVLAKYPLLNLGELLKQYPNMTLEEIVKKHPALKRKLAEMKQTLRPFNGDPQFGITTLTVLNGLSGASNMDLLFFLPNQKLYFMSTTWDGDEAQKLAFPDWENNYRRWKRPSPMGTESLGSGVDLKEWLFIDGSTEMTLRDLNYSGKLQRWQDLRDATNTDAQAAFAKYRLDTGGN